MTGPGNGVRLRWATVGTIAGVLLSIAVLFGTGAATWGGDRQRLASVEARQDALERLFEKRMEANETALRKHLETVEPITHRFVAVEQGVHNLTAMVTAMEARNEKQFDEIKRRLERYGFGKP